MAAIVSGSSLGLLNSSLYVLGSQGALGQATQGRAGEQVFVNADTGNLVIQNRDELLIGRGPDISILRTYNSQGLFDGDNNDNWRFGVYRKVTNLTGTVNTAGSTVTRVAEDGSESVYTFDATLGKYVCHDGGGAYDTLTFSSGTQTWTWSWTDGTNQLIETYDNATNGGRLLQTQGVKDQDTNSLSFTYNAAGLITQVTDANGESTFLDYTGTDLTQLRTVTTDRGTIIRTSYAYDGNHRLSKVTTDLTPDITNDSQTYVVTYTYDDTLGVSKRVATLTQTDGTRLTFAYVQVGTDFRVKSITDANGNITTFAYTQGGSVPASANANSAALSTTLTSSTDYPLVSSALTTPTVSWGTASLLAGSSTTSAIAPQVKFDQNGNGVAVWARGADLFYSTYSKSNNTWNAAQTLDGTLSGNPATPNLSMSANGNALVTWVQNSNVYARRYVAGVWDGAGAIPNLENLAGAVFNPVGAINDNGRAVVAFIQANGTPNNLYANVFNGTAWGTAATAVDDITTANANSIANTTRPSVAIDPFNNATVLWLQKTGTQTADSLYFSRFNPSTSTWGTPDSTTLENTTTAATAESIAFDANGNGIAIWLQGGTLFYRAYTRNTNSWTSGATAPSLATSVTSAHLSMSANGNGLVTWASGSNIFARRYAAGAFLGTAEAVESGAGAASSPVGSINDAGQAVVTFVQVTATPTTTTDVYASRYTNGAWQSAATIESSANSVAAAMTPSVAIDAQGNVNALWLQKNGAQATDSVFWNRFNTDTTPYYTIQNGGADWGSVATAVYGSSAAAARLQEVLGNPALTPGNRLTGFQATLTVTTTRTVAPDYTVTATDTWSSIAQAVYGDTAAAGPLQAALGSPALGAGLKLTVPASLTFTPVTAPSNPAAISTTDTQTTPQTFNLNTGAFTGASGNALTNWATVSDISASVDTWKFYTIDVPAGQSELFVGTSGGTGDADFYVRYGAAPDANTYDASGFDSETADEAALIQNPAAGTWYIGVLAFTAFSGVQLQTHYRSGIAGTTVLQPGIAASDLAGVYGTQRAFSFDVPAGMSSFTLSLTGQAGQDVDLYLRRGSLPTDTVFDFASDGSSENESISVNAPLVGTWFAVVEGFTNYTDTALVLHTNLGTNTPPTVEGDEPRNVLPGVAVSLAAAGSDAQGAVTYQWTQLSGPAVTLTGATSATASFTSPAVSGPTLLDFQVKVTDGQGATNTDIVHVVVAPASGAQSYTVKEGDSWSSIAIAFYGSDSVASPLQTALSNAPLTLGNILTGFPPTLPGTTTTTVTVPAYYTVPLGATWATVTQAVYGTSDANAQLALRDALGSAGGPSAPVVGSRLTPMPASIRYAGPAGPSTATTIATTVAPYYTVQPNQSWSDIALAVYGDAQAGGALGTAMGGAPSPTVGAHLTVPQVLPYTMTVAGGMRTDITDPLALGPTTMVTDAQGQLTQILMPAVGGVRQSVSYAYNANGDVTSVTDGRGLVTTYGYDANGNRTLERDAAGNTITRVFGSKNELETETSYVVPDPDGAGAGQPGTPLTTRYVYDTNGHLRFAISAEGRVAEYRYNSFGQRTAAIRYTGSLYNLTGLTTLQTPTESQIIINFVNGADKTKTERVDSTYNPRGQVATATSYTKVDTGGNGVADGSQSVTRYVYDQAGNLLQTIDGRGSVTAYAYDGLGRLTATTDAAGHPPTTTFYDDANRRVELTSSNQLKTTSTYDARGKLISVVQSATPEGVLGTTSYFYDADGRLRRTVDPTLITSHILYDEAGRKIATIDGTGTLTEYRYDADNNLTRTIQYATAVSRAKLDSLVDAISGQPTAATLSDVRPTPDASKDHSTWNAYDSANRLVKSVDELGFVTQYSYDGAGRPTDVKKFATPIGTGALGDTPPEASINPAGDSLNDRVTRNFYDADGRLRGALDPEGSLVEYKYNAAGEVVESVAYSKATDPSQRANGTLAQLIPVENASEAQSDIHTYTFHNAEGQVVGVVDGEGYLTESVYDAAGNKAQVIRYANKVAYTPADSLATLRSRVLNLPGTAGSYASTPDSPANSITGDIDLRAEIAPADWTPSAVRDVIAKNIGLTSGFSYRLRLETTGAISIYWSEEGTTVKSATSTASVPATDGAVKWIRAALDVNNGQSGRTIKFFTSDDYNPLTGSGTWTQLGSVITQAGATSIFNSAADLELGASGGTDNPFSGKIYYAEVWNGVDGAGAVVAKFDPSADSASTIATSLTSSSSNRELWTLSGAAALSTGNALDQVTTYTYTALNQLDTATDALGTRTKYSYNNVGNLTQTVIAQTTGDARTLNAQYDKQGRLKVEFSGAGIATNYTYDADGRRTSATDRNGNRTLFFYDSDGHLTHTIDALGEVTENKYNALGQVTQRVAYAARLSGTTLSNLNGGLVVNSTITSDVAAIANAALDSATSYTYTLRGQVASATDPLNQSTTSYTYDADGDVVSKTEAVGKPEVRNTRYVYDRDDRLVYTVDASGGVTKNEYDAEGRVAKTIAYTTALSDFSTLPATPTAGDITQRLRLSPSDQALTHVYDRDGREVYTIDALGGVTQRIYDAAGNVIQRIGYAKTIPANTLPTVAAVSAALVSVSDAVHDNNVRLVYDTTKRLVYSIDGLGEVTRNDYDARDNVVRTTLYDKALTAAQLTGLGSNPTIAGVQSLVVANTAVDRIEQRVFDIDDRLVYTIDSLGFVQKNDYDALGQVIRTTRYAQAIPVSTPATLGDVATALAANANRVGVRGLNLPGAAATFASTPSSAANSVTGDIDLRVLLNPDSWTPANAQALITKSDGGLDVDYGLRLFPGSTGKLQFVVNVTGASSGPQQIGSISTVGTGFAPGSTHWVRATRSASTGDVKFYTSDTYNPNTGSGTWAQLGATLHTTPGGLQVTAPTLQIGSKDAPFKFKGKIYYADVRNVIDGATVAVKFNPAEAGDTNAQSFASSSSAHETWTLSGGATLDSPSLTENQADTFAYDATGRPIYRVDAHGQVTRSDYDAKGNVIRSTEYATQVGISSLGATPTLASVQSVVNAIANAALDHVTQRVFDADNRLVYEIDAMGFVEKTDYDALGQVIRTTRYAQAISIPPNTPATLTAVAAALAANASSVPNPLYSPSQVTDEADIYAYDAAGHLVYHVDAQGDVSRNDYDSAGHVVRTTGYATPVGISGLGATPTLASVQSAVNGIAKPALDHVEQRVLDAGGHLLFSIDAAGFVTQRSYDGNGNVTREVRYAKALQGTFTPGVAPQILQSAPQVPPGGAYVVSDALDRVTRYAYDAADRPIFVIDAAGFVTQRFYNTSGNLVAELQYANPMQGVLAANAAPQLISSVAPVPASGAYVRTDAIRDRVTYRLYDVDGRMRFSSDAMGFLTERRFDAFGQEIQRIRYAVPVPVSIGMPASALNLPTKVPADAILEETHYDDVGRVLDMIDGNGIVTRLLYDAFGNPTDKVEALGRPEQRTTRTTYDALGRLTGQTTAFGTADAITTGFQFDAFGNQIASIDPRGYTTVQAFDNANRLVSSTDPLGNVTRTDYDAFGNPVRAVDPNGNAGYLYYDQRNLLVAQVDPQGDFTDYEYDAVGNKTRTIRHATRVSVTPVLGAPVTEIRPASNLLDEITTNAYDGLNRVTQIVDAEGHAELFGYDRDSNNVSGHQDKNGNLTRYEYDAVGNKIVERLPVPATAPRTEWQGEQLIELDDSGFASQARVAFDGVGNGVAVWMVNSNVYANRYLPDAGKWQGAQVIGTSNGQISKPALAVDAQGNAIAVWISAETTGSRIAAARYTAATGVWQAMPDVEIGNQLPDGPRIAFDAKGNATAVWVQAGAIHARRYDAVAGAWQADQTIGTGGPGLDLAVNVRTGDAIAVWRQGGATVGLSASRYSATTGSWVAAQTVANTLVDHPRVAIDSQGNAIAVFHGSSGIVAVRYSASTQSAQVIGSGTDNPQIAFDAQGNAIAVWETSDAGGISANRYSAATGSWQGVQTLYPSTSSSLAPQIAVDAQGNAIAVWQQFDGSRYNIYADRYLAAGSGWQGAQAIEGGAGMAINVQIAMDAQGSAIAAWEQSDGTRFNLTANRFEVATVVNRYDYDAFGNKIKETLAQGADEARVTQYVYDKNNRLTKTIEPEVLTKQSVLAPAIDSMQINSAGTASFTFNQTVSRSTDESTFDTRWDIRSTSLSVSWPPIVGLGGGGVRVVWRTGAPALGGGGEFSATPTDSSNSLTITTPDFFTIFDAGPYILGSNVFEVSLYKETPKGLVLITNVKGSYGWSGEVQDQVNTRTVSSQVPAIFQVKGNPAGQSAHLAYWASDGEIQEFDLESYGNQDGLFSAIAPSPLVPGKVYTYEAKVFDAKGDVVNAGGGSFTGSSNPTIGSLTTWTGAPPQAPQVLKAYDAAGNLIRETDANSNVTYSYYDANNRLIGTVDPDRVLRRYFYDAAGNLTAQRTYGNRVPGTGAIEALPDPATTPGMDPSNFREADYRYNANNLQIETSTQPVLVYDRAGGLRPDPVALVTTREYDRNGNVVLETDANGNKTYTYYDKADRKIAQVDASRYLTTWAYDAVGNVTHKKSFAKVIPPSEVVSTSSDPAFLVADLGTSVDDRACLYVYDRMNRLISETTFGVEVASLSTDPVNTNQPITGFGVTTDPLNVVVNSVYDNMGHLVAKIQKNVETDFAYDGLGRLVQETDPAFTDFSGATVRSTKKLVYDEVGNLKQVSENGNVTSYKYDPHGNLTEQIDPEGNSTRFYYDLNGNVTLKRTRRIIPDIMPAFGNLSSGADAIYEYDALNRQVSRTETRNFTYGTKYDAYGEIIAQGLKDGSPVEKYEEYEEYDKAGRLIKTNKDDGVDRAYLYDANGNQTATIQSGVQDIDIRSLTIDQIARLPVSAVQRTESAYDAKNQLTGVFETPIAATPGNTNVQDVWVDALDNPFLGGTMTPVKGASANFHFFGVFSGETAGRSSHTLQVAVSWAPVVGYGDGNIRVIFATSGGVQNEDGSPGSVPITAEATLGADATSVFFNPFSGFYAQEFGSYTIGIYKETFAGLQLVAGSAGTFNWTGGGVSGDGGPVEANVDVQNPDRLQFTGQRSDAQKLRLWLWPIGQPKGGFTDLPPQTAVTTDLGTSTLLAGQFAFPLNGTPPGQYNYEYQTLDGAGNVLDNVKGTVAIGGNSWQGAQLIEANANPVSAQQVAVDKQGNAIAVWIQSDGVAQSVYANLYVAASGAWLGAQPIETSSIAASDVQVAFDAQGNAFAVWNQGGVMANRYRAGTWQGAQPVPGSANKPQIALDAQGNAIVVSQIQSGTRQVFANRFVVSPDGTGAWQASQVIGSGAFGDLKIASDAKGNAIALWRTSDGLSDKLVVSRYDVATGFWQAPQTIATRSFIEFPKIAFDAQGNAMVVWDGGGVFAIRYLASTGTWQGMLPVNANSDTPNLVATGEIASIAFDAQGNAMAVWDQVDGAGVSNIWANRFVVSPDGTGAWQSPRLIENAPGLPFRAQVTVDALGNATAVWTQSDGTTTSVYANHYSVLTDTWQGAQLIESDPRAASGLAIAGNGAGDVMAVWNQSDLFANHYVPFTKQARTTQDVPANSTTAALINAGRTQSYNAFGQIGTETDALGHVTELRYNTRGDLVMKIDPRTTYTDNHGQVVPDAPITTRYFYDYWGRLVATQDPEGHKGAQVYDAAGHLILDMNPMEGAGALNLGFKRYSYDVHGDRRAAVDELGLIEKYAYDRMHHVTRVDHLNVDGTPVFLDANGARVFVDANGNAAPRFDSYAYDEEGRRIRHTDALGSDLTFYDSTGRVVRTIDAAGLTTRYDYIFAVVDTQKGRVGTKAVVTQQTADGPRTLVDIKDAFGRLLRHSDLGGHQFVYTYNKAGWLIQQYGDTDLAKPGIEQSISFTYYQNGLLKQTIDNVLKTRTGYEYDRNGNVTAEGYEQEKATGINYYQTARASYDALNRVVHVVDPKYTIDYQYDRNGNRRHVVATYNDRLNGAPQGQDYWYDYDALNRVTVTQGTKSGTTIDAGATGTRIEYYNDGQRKTANYTDSTGARVKDTYTYADGYLIQTAVTVNGAAVGTATRTYDALGRVVKYVESGRTTTYGYTKNGNVSVEDGPNGHLDYYYDDAGTLFRIRNPQGSVAVSTLYSYEYWDAPQQSQIQRQVTGGAPGQQPGFSNFLYDVNGHLVQVKDTAGGRTLRYALDAHGLVLERNEVTGSSSNTQAYYYLNGKGIGDSGFKPSRTDYASVLALGGTHPKTGVPISSADFDANFMPINDRYPATTPGTYTIQQAEIGATFDETLRNIALAVWGDASLWYVLADANALTQASDLKPGQTLVIPNVVTNIHNNAGTFKVYDAGEVIGDTSPTLPDPPPPPQQDQGCGVMELVIIAVIAVMVIMATNVAAGPILGSLFGPVAGPIVTGAVAAAAGSVVSQKIAVSAGLQDHFEWSKVGMAAVAAGVTGGGDAYTDGAGVAAEVGMADYLGKDLSLAFNAMVNNIVTQGIGKATGWQKTPFSWRSAAVAAAGALIRDRVTDFIMTDTDYDPAFGTAYKVPSTYSRWAGDFGARLTANFVSGVGTQLVRARVFNNEQLDYGQIFADSFSGTLMDTARSDMAAQEYLQRQNAQDYARDIEGSSDLPDSGRYTLDAPRGGVPGPLGTGFLLRAAFGFNEPRGAPADRLSLQGGDPGDDAAAYANLMKENALIVDEARARGESLAPTAANAIRLGLQDPSYLLGSGTVADGLAFQADIAQRRAADFRTPELGLNASALLARDPSVDATAATRAAGLPGQPSLQPSQDPLATPGSIPTIEAAKALQAYRLLSGEATLQERISARFANAVPDPTGGNGPYLSAWDGAPGAQWNPNAKFGLEMSLLTGPLLVTGTAAGGATFLASQVALQPATQLTASGIAGTMALSAGFGTGIHYAMNTDTATPLDLAIVAGASALTMGIFKPVLNYTFGFPNYVVPATFGTGVTFSYSLGAKTAVEGLIQGADPSPSGQSWWTTPVTPRRP